MSIHIHRYRSFEAPVGKVLCFPMEGTDDYINGDPYPIVGNTDSPHVIHCQDCGEPAVVIGMASYDEGWQDRYCINCARVMLDFVQKPAPTDTETQQ